MRIKLGKFELEIDLIGLLIICFTVFFVVGLCL